MFKTMKNEKNPPVEKGASLSENGSSVGNKMEAKILRSLMRSSKWHYCFNASCSKAQECAAFLSGKILIHDEVFYKELFYDEVVPTIVLMPDMMTSRAARAARKKQVPSTHAPSSAVRAWSARYGASPSFMLK